MKRCTIKQLTLFRRGMSRSPLRGFVLTETLVSLAIVLLLVPALAGILISTLGNVRRVESRLTAERVVTAAQITVLVLIRQDSEVDEIAHQIRRLYPSVHVELLPERIVLQHSDRGVSSAPTVEIAVPYGRRR